MWAPLITGCGFYVQVKEPTEPFSASQRLVEVIQLDIEKIQVTPEEYKPYVVEVAMSVLPINTLPTVAEDLSWKIALELKRHPDWLRPAPAGSP